MGDFNELFDHSRRIVAGDSGFLISTLNDLESVKNYLFNQLFVVFGTEVNIEIYAPQNKFTESEKNKQYRTPLRMICQSFLSCEQRRKSTLVCPLVLVRKKGQIYFHGLHSYEHVFYKHDAVTGKTNKIHSCAMCGKHFVNRSTKRRDDHHLTCSGNNFATVYQYPAKIIRMYSPKSFRKTLHWPFFIIHDIEAINAGKNEKQEISMYTVTVVVDVSDVAAAKVLPDLMRCPGEKKYVFSIAQSYRNLSISYTPTYESFLSEMLQYLPGKLIDQRSKVVERMLQKGQKGLYLTNLLYRDLDQLLVLDLIMIGVTMKVWTKNVLYHEFRHLSRRMPLVEQKKMKEKATKVKCYLCRSEINVKEDTTLGLASDVTLRVLKLYAKEEVTMDYPKCSSKDLNSIFSNMYVFLRSFAR